MIDCVGLASNLPLWTQLVVPIELRLPDEHVALLLIDRCGHLFEQQPQRVHVYAVAITAQSVEVFRIKRAPGAASWWPEATRIPSAFAGTRQVYSC